MWWNKKCRTNTGYLIYQIITKFNVNVTECFPKKYNSN